MLLITGATGFIGQYLVDELSLQGRDILACSRSMAGRSHFESRGIPYQIADVTSKRDLDGLPRTGVTAVVHLAALVPKPPKVDVSHDYVTDNVLGTLNILEYCRTANVKKLIYVTSHYEACNIRPLPIKEEYPIVINYNDDHSAYIISKIAARSYVQHYAEAYGIQAIILRMTGVRGHNKWANLHDGVGFNQGFWEAFIDKARKSQPIEVWGNNANVRDHLYVKDAVAGIVAALDSSAGKGLYNLASGVPITLEEEIKAIVEVFSPPENPSKLVYRPKQPGLRYNFVYDITKARDELNYSPKFSYLDMLKDYKKSLEEAAV
jgi:UDP-glucose 4-epimerase